MDEFTKMTEFPTKLNCYLAKGKPLQDDLSPIRAFFAIILWLKN